MLKILTYNVWHGLCGEGRVYINSLESSGRKNKRFIDQIEQIKKADPDVIFLQEVNPLPTQAKKYADILGYDFDYQMNQSGIHLFNLGIPINLRSGIVTLTKKHFKQKLVAKIPLSGTSWAFNKYFSFTLSEYRTALLTGISHPTLGDILLINTHLHHGLEWNKELQNILGPHYKNNLISKDDWDLLPKLLKGGTRRECEIDKILKYLEINKLDNLYNNVIFAGDLNDKPDSVVCKKLEASGLCNSYKHINSQTGFTWDAKLNKTNQLLSSDFKLPYGQIKNELIQAELMKHFKASKYLDYIFVSNDLKNDLLTSEIICTKEYDYGDEAPALSSDHLAVLTTLT